MANDEFEVKSGVVMEATDDLDAVQGRKRRSWKHFFPRVLTLILAVVIWVCVMEINPPDAYKTFEDVPVRVVNLSGVEITLVDGGEFAVDVTVQAKKNRINALNEEQITLVIDTYGIDESGTYQLEILCVLPSGYQVHSLSQETITVSIDAGSENS